MTTTNTITTENNNEPDTIQEIDNLIEAITKDMQNLPERPLGVYELTPDETQLFAAIIQLRAEKEAILKNRNIEPEG